MGRKILMTTMSLGIGGAETHIVELSKQLQKNGEEVVIASNGGIHLAEIEKAGIRHYKIPMDERSICVMAKSFFMLWKVIRKEKPDIVHAHARIPAFLCAALRPFLRFNFLTSAHGVFDPSGFLRLLTRWGKKTVAVSDDIKQYLIRNYRLNPSNISVTVNGIDTEKFSVGVSGENIIEEFGIDPEKPVVTSVSRLDDQSSLATAHLIDIADRLERLYPGIQILVVGSGTMFKKLNAMADAVNERMGKKTVIMTGGRKDINELIAVCDVFVGVSRSALEAMSSQKPVILAGDAGYLGVFDDDKLPRAVESNFCCRGCPPTNGDSLFEDVSRILNMTAEEAAECGKYNRGVILERYSLTKMTDDYMRAYRSFFEKVSKIVLSGYYGYNNSGDEAILHSIINNISSVDSLTSITVLSNMPDETSKRHGCRAIYRFNILRIITAVMRCDAVVSGGGSLLQDYTSTRSLIYYLAVIRIALFFKKKTMVYANGIGPVSIEKNRRRIRRVLDRVDIVTLRDHSSAQELKNMGSERELIVTADPTFTLKSIPEPAVAEFLYKHNIKKSFIGISIREWHVDDSQYEKIAALCDTLYDKTGYDIVFIVMQVPADVAINNKVRAMMKRPSIIIDGNFSSEALLGIIGAARFIIAMRLHTLIFAARNHIPFAGIIYDPKVEYYLDMLSMPSLGRIEDFDDKESFEIILDCFDDYQNLRRQLSEKAVRLEEEARNDVKYLQELLNDNKKL
jgi:polysaccharide pyruvyl transferase CsaB